MKFLILLSSILSLFFVLNFVIGQASYELWYEFFDNNNNKIGYMMANISTDKYNNKEVHHIKSEMRISTNINVIGINLKSINLTSIGVTKISKEGVEYFHSQTKFNDTLIKTVGKRMNGYLYITRTKDDKKENKRFKLSSFDSTSIDEMFPKRVTQKVGSSKTLRILYIDRLEIAEVTTKVLDFKEVTFEGNKYKVYEIETIRDKGTSKSWVLPDGKVLKTFGDKFIVSLSNKDKAKKFK